jgi:hypothetical protein
VDPFLANRGCNLGAFKEHSLVPGMRQAAADVAADGACAKDKDL